MNKKKRIFIITGIIIAVIIAVLAVLLFINKKNETPTNTTNVDGVVLKENVIVITDETDDDLQPYNIDENNLYFKKRPKYQETEIIVSGITKTAPNGYIRKIVKIEEINGEYVLKTEPATFLDVFEVLHLTATIELTEDESGNFSVDETTKNALSILPKLSLSATNKSTTKSSISKDKDSDNSNDDNGKRKNLFEIEFDEEIDDIVHLQGNASAKVWLEIKIDIEAGEITWSLTANDEIQSHILIGCGASYEKEFEKELFSKQLPNIQIMAGPIPIVITNEVGANLAFEAGIAGEIGTSVDILQTSKNGFVYTSKDCSVKEINDGELNSGGVECTTGAKATGTAKAGVVLSLTSLFYDCSGAELGLGVEASAEGEIALNDKTLETDEKYYGKLALAISPCISCNIIVQIPVIDDDLYEMEIFKVELKPFWEKVWENKDTNEIVDVLEKLNQSPSYKNMCESKRAQQSNIDISVPIFSFYYPDNWKITEDNIYEKYETISIENERGVEIRFSETWETDGFRFLDTSNSGGFLYTNYGYGYRMQAAKLTQIKKSSFVPGKLQMGDYSYLGEFVIAKMEINGYYNTLPETESFFTPYDDNDIMYTVIPKSYTTDYSGEFVFKNMDYVEDLSWDYPQPIVIIATSPDGTFTPKEEQEVINILSTFNYRIAN